jgi:ribonucleoside-triphosphate reductase
MVKQVVKRDGRVVKFNRSKIASAIQSAMEESGDDINYDVANTIALKISEIDDEVLEVDAIHKQVEKGLSKAGFKKSLKMYKSYRTKRDIARKAPSRRAFKEIIEAKASEVTRENANMNADTPAGMMMKFASENTKSYAKDILLSESARDAMDANFIHIHDLDYYPTKSLTCIQHPLDRLFDGGFTAGHGESRAPKRIETAAIQACISMEAIQNEMHGGQAIPAFDFYLAPYVRKTFIEELNKLQDITKHSLTHLHNIEIDDYVKKDVSMLDGDELYTQYAMNATVDRVHQAMEAFVHNMNMIHSRGGNQVVFSSINYGTDTSAEGRCIIREILNTTYRGVGNNSTAIFPIQIWKKKRGVSYLPEDKNYDLYQLACKVSARRFFPNFVNLDASFNQHELWDINDPERYKYEVATMGCRTRVFENRFGQKSSVGRGNLSFTTINIVKLAIDAAIETGLLYKRKGDKNYTSAHREDCEESKRNKQLKDCETLFFGKLDRAIDIAAKQLDERFNFQKTAIKKQFPLLMNGMWNGSDKLDSEDSIESVINQGTLGIGFIGLAEALIALRGSHHGESEWAQELGLRIVTHMRDKANEYSEKYQHNYSILATPAEGLSGKFTKCDKDKYGVIDGITDKEYYTNSNHVPVYYKCTPSHKAKVEGPYHDLTRGGHIFYVEVDGDATHNPEAIMRIVDLMDKYNIGYCSVNHNRNRCLKCGYENAEKEMNTCPKCGSEDIDTLQRITGYLVGTTSRWNNAKLSELRDRVTHE